MDVYLKLEKKTQVKEPNVCLSDIGRIYCQDPHIASKLKCMRVHQFREQGAKRCVMSALKIIELMQEACPKITVQNIGEAELVLEMVDVRPRNKVQLFFKILIVSLISFFGSAFTIMAYHNDIGISQLFQNLYQLFMGEASDGWTELEVAYSVGLCVGITVFFNHIGRRRLTSDPTPIEAEMFEYEDVVEDTLIHTANREGVTLDVD